MWSKPLDYVQMDVPLPCHGARYQNLWDDRKDLARWKDNKIELFLHVEALRDVVHRSHQIHAATVHRYAAFINFQARAHNMILEPKKDSARQVHHAGFMLKDEDVDEIINIWLEEWNGTPAEPLPEGQDE